MSAETKAAWLGDRAGCLTASRMADAMSFLKNGRPSESRTRYMMDLLAERVTGLSVRNVVTPAMERGLEYEDEMFDLFVERYPQYDVRPSRLYSHPTIENFKATPDREIDGDGLLEGKVPSTAKFIAWTIAGVVPEEHKPQLLAQLLCSGKKWVGFVAYAPDIKDERRRLFLRRYEPTAEELGKVEAAAIAFLAELDAMFERFVTA